MSRTTRFQTRPRAKIFLVGACAALLFSLLLRAAESPPPAGKTSPLFDGKTLGGWEGDPKLWRVEDGCLTGGSLTQAVTHNDFVASTGDFTNFIVRMQIKLTGKEGFINSGFQIRSQRVPKSSEMACYQCDYGDPNWWGAIYDESRRNKVMSPSDMKALGPVIKRDDWNEYVIRADGPRITTWLNGVMGTDYTEADPNIPDWGKFGIQVHGGGKALVQVKDVTIQELPPEPRTRFRGAPEPRKGAKASPLSPAEEWATFTLPPGFEIELVASESEGIGKFVTVDWDLHGRMWSMTALEYPVDANENPAAAKELYASKAKDKVLVWDTPFAPGPQTPRVFADRLAIPLGVLPYKNGVYVQHGTEIVFLSDTDGGGRADQRKVILSGFGVQDSHLFPHQFTRAPGNWIWMAQGAFNYGKVRTTKGSEVKFDQTRMARFRYDGSEFDITSQGPCNIWGLVLTGEGEAWIQEANDYGYPVMPFHAYANYPGCSDGQFKSYAPEFPGTAPDFQMGGTGLSGLALSDEPEAVRPDHASRITHHDGRGWPAPYAGVMESPPSPEEIRADFDHSFEGETKPDGLIHYFSGPAPGWGKLHGSAKVEKSADFPTLLTAVEARAQAEKFAKFRSLAANSGDAMHGKALFTTTCMICHSVAGQGAQIGPVLNGAGASGVEALLRNILTPNAAMEAGYRLFRLELRNGEVLDGLLVSQDKDAIILRRPNSEDQRIPQSQVRRADFTKMSIMPEGLLDALQPEEVTDLFAYLKILK